MLQPNGVFTGFYYGLGPPVLTGVHPDEGLRTERMRSISFTFYDDDEAPYIVTRAVYEGEHGPTVAEQLTFFNDGFKEEAEEEVAISRGLLGMRTFHDANDCDRIPIFDGYSLGEFARAAYAYVTEALGGVPGPQRTTADDLTD